MACETRTPAEVQALLTILWEEDIQRQLDGATRNEKTFHLVCERLQALGYTRTPDQCRAKCKKLRSDYRKVKDHNSRSGVQRKNWRWFDAMDQIYGSRPASLGRDFAYDTAAKDLSLTDGNGGTESFLCSTFAETTELDPVSSTPEPSPETSTSQSGDRDFPAARGTLLRTACRRREQESLLPGLLRELLATEEKAQDNMNQREHSRRLHADALQAHVQRQQEAVWERQQVLLEQRRAEWLAEQQANRESWHNTFLQGVSVLAQAITAAHRRPAPE